MIVKVDDQPLIDFAYFQLAADLMELQRSVDQSGEYFIITCSCGWPECAGIKRGIQVSHQGECITWVYQTLRPDPATQPELLKKTKSRRPEWVVRGIELPTKTFIFDRAEYRAAIRQGIQQGTESLQKVGNHKGCVIPEHNLKLLETNSKRIF